MHVLPDQENTIVMLDKQTGDLRYVYRHPNDAPLAQYAIDMKYGTSYGQVTPAPRKP